MAAYEDALTKCHTTHAPWYVVPANHKWATRTIVADIITTSLQSLDLSFPQLSEAQRADLTKARKRLLED